MISATLRLSRVSTAVAIVFALAAAPAAAAVKDYLILGDIKGETPARGTGSHRDEIHVESFSWGMTNQGAHGVGGGGGAGKVNVHDISMAPQSEATARREASSPSISEVVVTKDMDTTSPAGDGPVVQNSTLSGNQARAGSGGTSKSTPKLLESAARGKVFKSPAPSGSMTAVVPAGTCRVGARYPTAELGTGTRVYTMTGVVVTGCTAASDGSIPTETLSLNYQKIIWK